MLTGIRLRNFKCFEELNLEKLGRINVFIGPNGSGKSSVLQALMALRQSLGGDVLKLRGEYVDLVGFKETVFGGRASDEIGVGISGCSTFQESALEFKYDARFGPSSNEKAPVSSSASSVRLRDLHVEVTWQRNADVVAGPKLMLGSRQASTWPRENVGEPLEIKFESGIPHGHRDSKSIKIALEEACAAEIRKWQPLTTLRGFEEYRFPLGPSPITSIAPFADRNEISAGIASTLAYDHDGIALIVSEWMEQVTGVPLSSKLEVGQHVALRVRRGGLGIPIIAEGFGTNQLVFIMFGLAQTQHGGRLMIEEPETHLHPLAISKLGDLLVRIAHERDLQLILTTHSEYLLVNLLNNVSEGKLAVDDLGIYYFEREGDRCTARRLGITERGMVEGGLPGFFDAALEAQRRQMDALVHAT